MLARGKQRQWSSTSCWGGAPRKDQAAPSAKTPRSRGCQVPISSRHAMIDGAKAVALSMAPLRGSASPRQHHAAVVEDAVAEVAVGGEAGVVPVVDVVAGDLVAAAIGRLHRA